MVATNLNILTCRLNMSFYSFWQLFATILDYAEAGENDHSDGRSLRSFIERHETNVDFDEDVVFAEW
jgi:hypothetical protein